MSEEAVRQMRDLQATAVVSLKAFRQRREEWAREFLIFVAEELREATQRAQQFRRPRDKVVEFRLPFIPIIQVDAQGRIIRQSLAP